MKHTDGGQAMDEDLRYKVTQKKQSSSKLE